MTDYLKLFLFVSLLLLLWTCGETTPPVKPTPAQAERLLGGEVQKSWKRIYSLNKLTGKALTCFDSAHADTLIFIVKKDSLNFKGSACDSSMKYMAARYNLVKKDGKNYINFYKRFISLKDSLNLDTTKVSREITYITDKEFTSETTYSGLTVMEKFEWIE